MATKAQSLRRVEVDHAVRKFLREHPEAKEAIEVTGMTLERYKALVEAQAQPRFYNAVSTTIGGEDDQLAGHRG